MMLSRNNQKYLNLQKSKKGISSGKKESRPEKRKRPPPFRVTVVSYLQYQSGAAHASFSAAFMIISFVSG